MKEVMKYEDLNGKCHDTPAECLQSDRKIRLTNLIAEDNDLYLGPASPKDVAEFIINNLDKIQEALS